MKLLIITHDPVETLDRRIVNESRVFTDHGWKVHIVLTSFAKNCKAHEIERDIVVDPIPLARVEPVYDPLFHDSPVAEFRNALTRRFTRESRTYRLMRSCYLAMNSVESWLRGEDQTRLTSPCDTLWKDTGGDDVRPASSALLQNWIKRQTPKYTMLTRNARRAYLTVKAARTLFSSHSHSAIAAGTNVAELKYGAEIRVDGASSASEEYPLPHTLSFLKKARGLSADAILACDLPSLPAGLQLSVAWQVPLIYDSHEFLC